ncbi:MAG: hypothetical protein ACJA0E_000840, partial [Bermanella sp.]
YGICHKRVLKPKYNKKTIIPNEVQQRKAGYTQVCDNYIKLLPAPTNSMGLQL